MIWSEIVSPGPAPLREMPGPGPPSVSPASEDRLALPPSTVSVAGTERVNRLVTRQGYTILTIKQCETSNFKV